MAGLYVHVPFCVSKCAYCDFFSLPDRLDLVPTYIDAVLAEAWPHAGMSFDTLYLGGGTPSLLGATDLEKLIGGLKGAFDLSRLAEATIEVNPESASEGLLRSARQLGFTRVSVGVQSLSDPELRSVGRVHTAAQAVGAVSRAVGAGFRDVSADVIVGLPGQKPWGASKGEYTSDSKSQIIECVQGVENQAPEMFAAPSSQRCAEGLRPSAEGLGVSPNSTIPPQEWGHGGLRERSDADSVGSLRQMIGTLIDLGVSHLSVYCLSLEHDTPLALNPPDDLPTEDDQADLFEEARTLLERHGFTHYEISNFCLPGRECRHNLNYWRGGQYLGLGPAAASHLDNRRWKNRADLLDYLRGPCGIASEAEELGLRQKAAEEAMLRLRLLVEGLSGDEMARRFGQEGTKELFSRLNALVAEGALTFDGTTYRLPRSRVLTSNPILAKVLA